MTITAFIFARGGSKGVQGKNIKLLAGKPLLAYAIDQARNSKADRIFVSTDCCYIAHVARSHNVTVIDRPAELATDESPEWLSWQHAVKFVGMTGSDVFVSVPATCPLRDPVDINNCIDALAEGTADMAITITESRANPYFNLVETSNGRAQLAVQALLASYKPYARRQDAPPYSEITGVAYATTAAFVLKSKRMWDGKIVPVSVPLERAIDIDTPYDFLLAELLMRHKLENAREEPMSEEATYMAACP